MDFVKLVGSGNDFVLIDRINVSQKLNKLAITLCDRKFGIGADGLLVLESSKKADIRMRIFNADGSEAEMCGNGARCTAYYMAHKRRGNVKVTLETKVGPIASEVNGDLVRINLTDPKDLLLHIPLLINGRPLKVHFINTGVPHAVVMSAGLDAIDVHTLGRIIRNHPEFQPKGTNVNFVEVQNDHAIRVRTYERGVEAETLACGTGMTASALVFSALYAKPEMKRCVVDVYPASMEHIKVSFAKEGKLFKDVWLQGKVKQVFAGRS